MMSTATAEHLGTVLGSRFSGGPATPGSALARGGASQEPGKLLVWTRVSERRLQAGLLADFVCGDAIERTVALDRDDLAAVGIDGVLPAFTYQSEAILLKDSDQIPTLDAQA
jgi:hypothetical protein